MEPRPRSPGGVLSGLPDRELVERFCANRKDEQAAQELWHRFGDVLYEALKKSCRHIRPDTCDYRTFLDSCFSRAYFNFFARICGFRFEGPVEAWLAKVAATTALDERRSILRVRARPAGDEREEQVPPVRMRETPLEDLERQLPDATFRSKRYRLRSQVSIDVIREIAGEERKYVVRELLTVHAADSEKSAESARTIRLHHWKNRSKADIARYYFGEPADEREQNTREQRIGRLLAKDYEALQTLLEKVLGITSLRQI